MPFTGDYSYESHEMGMLPFRVKILGAKVMYFGENAKCFDKKEWRTSQLATSIVSNLLL